MATKERNSAIELLRIIAIVMIMLHHYVVNSGFIYDVGATVGDLYLMSILQLGQWAVNIFVLIFGYFSVKSEFKPAHVLRLYAEVWFYSVVIFIAYMLWNHEMHYGLAVRAIFPVIGNQYWFFSQYILLCLLMPFLNILIKNMSRKLHLKLIMLLFAAWSILPCFLPRFFDYGLDVGSTGAFVLLYFVGAYMRLYPDSKLNKKLTGCVLTIGSFLAMMLIQFVNIADLIPFVRVEIVFYSNTEILGMCFAIGMLSIFNNIGIKPNKFINSVAACTFGVYLIIDSYYLRPFIWRYLLKNYQYLNSGHMLPHMLISVAVVFAVCVAIEFIRKNTVEKLWIRYCEPWLLKMLTLKSRV